MDGDNAYGLGGEPPPEPPAGWPRISDYWPDGQRRPPAVDRYEWPGVEPVGGTPTACRAPDRLTAWPVRAHRDTVARWRRRWWQPFFGAVLAVAVTTGALMFARTTGMTTATGSDRITAPSATGEERPNPAPPRVEPAPPPALSPVEEPAPSSSRPLPAPSELAFTAGTFELLDGLTELTVLLLPLDTQVFRVSAPPDSGVTPQVTVIDSTVRLGVVRNGKTGRARVDLQLNQDVTWSLRMIAGVEQGTFDLSQGRVRRIDLIGGAARLEISVPDQPTPLPIRMTGGLNIWRIATEREPNVRVLLREGGGEVQLDEQRFRGVARGTTLVTGNGRRAGRLDIDAVAGLGSLTVTRG